MSAICTPEEIAEKKRIAQERLKQKLAAKKSNAIGLNNGITKNSNTTSSIFNNNVLTTKGSSTFYNNTPSTDFKKPNTNNNLNKPIQNENNSYKKFISALPNQIDLQSEVKSSPARKNYTIFNPIITCEITLISDTRFIVKPSKYHEQLINVFKTIPSKLYDSNTRFWTFHINDYEILLKHAENLKSEVELTQIPKPILDLISKPDDELDYSCLPSIESKLQKSLLEFQKDGVCFGIAKRGRVMIADEMGLGKTLQALAISDYYKEDWPLLITTTASTRSTWFNHIKDYLPSVRCHDVVTLNSADFFIHDAKIVITSYALMEKSVQKLMEHNFGVFIFDESHHLKSFDAKRTKNAAKLTKNARRVILLSGTPALSKPVELYSQIKMIDKNYLPFKAFSLRYCDGKQTNFGWDSTGQSNLAELNVILKKRYMIRRLKSEVLSQLAQKNRETIKLNPELIKLSEEVKKDFSNFESKLTQSSPGNQSKDILLIYYAKTAEIKVKAVCSYLKSLIKENKKFIVFAHHKIMMNAISDFLFANKIDFVRIDGSTKSDLRAAFVQRFQTKTSCRVALLSLLACNAGITLTATDLVIFAELDWNPSTLAQAESRAHRIGQQNTVTCRYLLAENTADTIIWKMLKEKQDVLSNAGLFSENLQNAEHCLAPTSTQKIEKYLTPIKRKVEDFYKPVSLNFSDNAEGTIQPKKLKMGNMFENSSKVTSPRPIKVSDKQSQSSSSTVIFNEKENILVDLTESQDISTKDNKNSTKRKDNEYDYLFNELDDADIPSTPAILTDSKTKPIKNEYDELFNEMEDAELAGLNF